MKKKFTNAATTSTTISLSASKTIVISSEKPKTEKPTAKSPTTMIKQDQSNTEADENSEKNQILIQLQKSGCALLPGVPCFSHHFKV